jgi:hypothetical protein
MAQVDTSTQERIFLRNIGWELFQKPAGCGEGVADERPRGVGELVSSRLVLARLLISPSLFCVVSLWEVALF